MFSSVAVYSYIASPVVSSDSEVDNLEVCAIFSPGTLPEAPLPSARQDTPEVSD